MFPIKLQKSRVRGTVESEGEKGRPISIQSIVYMLHIAPWVLTQCAPFSLPRNLLKLIWVNLEHFYFLLCEVKCALGRVENGPFVLKCVSLNPVRWRFGHSVWSSNACLWCGLHFRDSAAAGAGAGWSGAAGPLQPSEGTVSTPSCLMHGSTPCFVQ